MQLHKEVVLPLAVNLKEDFLGECNEISAGQFQEMVQAGATRLHTNAEYVNSLNVSLYPMVIQEQI